MLSSYILKTMELKRVFIIVGIVLLTFQPAQTQLDGSGIAPNFTLTDIDGVEHELYNYLDQGKVVILDFFAVWCSICKADADYLKAVNEAYGPSGSNQIVMLSLEGDDSSSDDETREFAEEFGSGNPHINNTGTVNDLYRLNGYPTYYAIAPDRSYVIVGGRQETMQHKMEEAILTSPPLRTVDNDVRLMEFYSPKGSICNNSIAPQIRIQNYGKNLIQRLQVEVLIDGLRTSIFTHSDSLLPYHFADLSLVPIENIPDGWHDIEFRFVEINGMADSDPDNGIKGGDFLILDQGEQITVSLTTDSYPKETSWGIFQDGKTLARFSGYDKGLSGYSQEVCVEAGICYQLVIYDQYGDGMSSGGIEVSYLGDKIGQIDASEFNKDSASINICIWPLSTGDTEKSMQPAISIFPNPSSGEIEVSWQEFSIQVSEIQVTSMTGQVILSKLIAHKQNKTTINLSDSSNGIYFVRLITTYGPLIKKVIVSH